ncbi:MAG: hypothetical protein AABZ33_07625 [Chloroflexota bacterium]
MSALEWHEVLPPEWNPSQVRLVARRGDLQAVITESYPGHVELAIYDEGIPPDVVTVPDTGQTLTLPNLIRFGRPQSVAAAKRAANRFTATRETP